jgi:hypothetical protein
MILLLLHYFGYIISFSFKLLNLIVFCVCTVCHSFAINVSLLYIIQFFIKFANKNLFKIPDSKLILNERVMTSREIILKC